MPIPPPPFKLRCPSCHWSRVMVSRSDVISPSAQWMSRCPRCAALLERHASTAPFGIGLLAVLFRWFKSSR